MKMTRTSNGVVRQSITAALLELMGEMPFEKITVTKIADRAQVARVSFYRNFTDKDDVLRQYAHAISEEFLERLEPGLLQSNPRAFVFALLEHMRAYHDHMMLLMASQRMGIVREEFDRAFEVGGRNRRESARRRFLSGGLFNLYLKWALEGYDPPAEAIADFVCELVG